MLAWLLGDHLGGTAYTVSGTAETGEVRYKAFGATRFTSGTTPTTYRFTGQREEASLGLYDYNARWYDPALGQFLSPDTIVPAAGNALDYHRYAYTRFNPVRYEDDSGHCATLANGQADENDADCWRLARTIGNLWNVTDYWRTRFGELDVWNNYIAPSGVNAEFMQSELSAYLQSDAYKAWAAANPASGYSTAGIGDWGDYTSGSISFGPIQFALTVDDYGNGYIQGGVGAAGLGASVNRGDIIATVGEQTSDIDYLSLSEGEKRRLAVDTLIGPGVSGSLGFFFLSVGGNVNWPIEDGGSAEGGFNTSRGFSLSLQAAYTMQIYPELRFK